MADTQRIFDAAVAEHQAGRLPEADSLYRQVLASEPNHLGAMQMLGVLAHQAGRDDVSTELFRRLISLAPNNAEAHNNLGVALAADWKLEEAEGAYRRALSLRPDFPQAHNNLGSVLRDMGSLDEAIVSYGRAIQLTPDYPEAQRNLGLALMQKGRLSEAISAFQQAVKLDQSYAEAIYDLGTAYGEVGYVDLAIASQRRALALRPDYFDALVALAKALKDAAQIGEAVACYRQALQIKPDARVHAAMLFALHYLPGVEPRQLLEEHRWWNELYARPLAVHIRPYEHERSPDRRLRIGYVSADLSDHPVGRCLLPVLTHRDRESFEVYCYAGVRKPDEITSRFQKQVDGWRDTLQMSDEQLSEQIRKDGIDILVDLAVHTAGSRLLAFARKPAPVQVTWLGWPGTTGMDAIDYRLSDPYLDAPSTHSTSSWPPPGTGDEFYSERTVRLPNSFWCYEPGDRTVEMGGLPALRNGFVTFGCLGNFWKVNDGMIALWVELMANVKGSRLLIRAPLGGPGRRMLENFQRHGIDPGKIELAPRVPPRQYWEFYQRIDITLDTTPYAAHTTAMDSIWMGVPVVSLIGKLPVGRAGLTILSNIGLPELAASNAEQYVTTASELASDRERLSQLRGTLRDRLRNSPVMDAPRFARDLETAYRQMWREWCNR